MCFVDGLIPTGILFDGDAEAFAAAGIQVSLGFSGQPPAPLVNANVPEPQFTPGMTILLAVGMLRARTRRRASQTQSEPDAIREDMR